MGIQATSAEDWRDEWRRPVTRTPINDPEERRLTNRGHWRDERDEVRLAVRPTPRMIRASRVCMSSPYSDNISPELMTEARGPREMRETVMRREPSTESDDDEEMVSRHDNTG